MLWDIDLIFGMWVYSDKLQIEFTFRSGPMIFGQVMALGLFGQIFSCHHFFSLCLEILIFGMRVYNLKLQISFEIRSGWMIFGQHTVDGVWNVASYLVVTTCFSLRIEILTRFLVCECIVMSYLSSLNFVPIEWFWAKLRTLDFLTLVKY